MEHITWITKSILQAPKLSNLISRPFLFNKLYFINIITITTITITLAPSLPPSSSTQSSSSSSSPPLPSLLHHHYHHHHQHNHHQHYHHHHHHHHHPDHHYHHYCTITTTIIINTIITINIIIIIITTTTINILARSKRFKLLFNFKVACNNRKNSAKEVDKCASPWCMGVSRWTCQTAARTSLLCDEDKTLCP